MKMFAFCLTQVIVVRGFRTLSRGVASATKSKLRMAAEYSMPDQQARFAKAKTEGSRWTLNFSVCDNEIHIDCNSAPDNELKSTSFLLSVTLFL